MGRKVHPTGFRVGVTKHWQARWFSERGYVGLVHEDLRMRRVVFDSLPDAGISGIVIDRGGANVEQLRSRLERSTDRRVRLNIEEIRVPELDAYLVARSVADQLERRVAFRRAMKQSVQRTMQRGAEGCKIKIGGRLGGVEMSRSEYEMRGRVPLHTIRADIDYGLAEARTTFGVIGVKCWIYKGEITPDQSPFVLAGQAEAE